MEINGKKVELKQSATSLKTSQRKISLKTGLPISWISALFVKFQARYGYKFTGSVEGIEEQAVNEWAEELAGLTGDQIAHGLDVWDGAWPPSSQEFKSTCTGRQQFNISTESYKACTPDRKLLSSTERDIKREETKSHIQAMRNEINRR